MTKVTIDRELLERIDESAICDGTDATISDDLFTQLVAALDAPQPSAGVVMPERKQLPDLMFAEFHESRGWNACLDEFARLNKGAGIHE